tara:strand:- start:1556 stop:2437 length:882 start_codon:yes stop_codon:yes gene_type:complete
MKKLLVLFILSSLIGCNNSKKEVSSEQNSIDSLTFELKTKNDVINKLENNIENSDSLVNQYSLYFKQIKENLAEINENEIYLRKLKINKKENLELDSLDIVSAINSIAKKLKENESLIKLLNKKIDGNKNQNLRYQQEINNLNEIIAKSNREVYFLQEEISGLNSSFSAIFEKYNEQKITISNLNSKLNEIAYVIGTKSELLKNNILSKEGGFIGIGKSRKLSSELNTDYFTFLSKTEFKSLTLGYKSVKLITSHPVKSYELINNSEEIIDSLVIIDKDLFWNNSKYLVIEVR